MCSQTISLSKAEDVLDQLCDYFDIGPDDDYDPLLAERVAWDGTPGYVIVWVEGPEDWASEFEMRVRISGVRVEPLADKVLALYPAEVA